jgi:hypothetical protein
MGRKRDGVGPSWLEGVWWWLFAPDSQPYPRRSSPAMIQASSWLARLAGYPLGRQRARASTLVKALVARCVEDGRERDTGSNSYQSAPLSGAAPAPVWPNLNGTTANGGPAAADRPAGSFNGLVTIAARWTLSVVGGGARLITLVCAE